MDKMLLVSVFCYGVAYGVVCTMLILHGGVQRTLDLQLGEYEHQVRKVSDTENELRSTLNAIEAKQRLDYSIAERMSQPQPVVWAA